jgi:hypothetical protein
MRARHNALEGQFEEARVNSGTSVLLKQLDRDWKAVTEIMYPGRLMHSQVVLWLNPAADLHEDHARVAKQYRIPPLLY